MAQLPGDEHWDVRFGFPGVDGSTPLAVATQGSDVYVGGDLTLAGPRNANRIARWNGREWSALAAGMAGESFPNLVYSISPKGSEIYVGGFFTNAGGLYARGLAKWDGTNWSAMPGNFHGVVFKTLVAGNNLYVAGNFLVGDDTNNYVFAKFDGADWTTYGSTVSGCVGSFCTPSAYSIVVDGSDIYLGGQFTVLAGVTVNHVAKWNGSTWSALGTGLGGTTIGGYALAKHGTNIIAGGTFTSAGGVSANNLARWDGTVWSAFGDPNNIVQDLRSASGQLYAAGRFSAIGGGAAGQIARWDGTNWNTLGAGVGGTAYSMSFSTNGDLFVSGAFTIAGTAPASGIARWSGGSWSSVGADQGNGMNRALGLVRAFDQVGTNLYVGGSFSSVGGVNASRVGRWDGTSWTNLGVGVIGTANHFTRTIAHLGSDVYFGGFFTNMAGLVASNIARWNGASWNTVGLGINSNVNAMVVSGGELYVGGPFTQAGGVPMNRVAKWNGSGWLTLGSGMNSNVIAMAAATNGDVYAGGTFTTAGGVSANKVAKWNNATGWTPLGNGINFGTVNALAIKGSNVYVGGSFPFADSIQVNHVACWNGVSWSALGSGIDSASSSTAQISALAVHGNDLYAAGTITSAGGVVANAIARWNGTNWNILGSGMTNRPGSPSLLALYDAGDSLYVGGNFVRSGMRPAANMARYVYDVGIPLTGARLSGGALRFRATNLLGLKYRVDTATDMPAWNGGPSEYSFVAAREFTNSTFGSRQFLRVLAEP